MKSIHVLLFLILAACGSKAKHQEAPTVATVLPQTLEQAVDSSFRTPENQARDIYRHPLATLKFFGVQPNMTVVEIWPSSGWYTQILAPYLAANGHYIAATPKDAKGGAGEGAKKLESWIKANPEASSTITSSNFNPPDNVEIAPAGTADMVLTFRNVHNWMMKKGEVAAFKSFFKALKPGGILGVVEHRAKTKGTLDLDSGYVGEKSVIALAKKAGFKLVAKSEINANPKDTKNYEKGVWTLPPSNKHDEKDDAKYKAIGESDRMTIKFIKPKK